MNLIDELKNQTIGDVLADPISTHVYSIDASIYEIRPTVIVIPKDMRDVETTVALSQKYRIPITPRGAATGITGGCLGKGIILDMSVYFNKILEINIENRYAICEPGVIQDQLNHALYPMGYRLGPDTSTGNRATLGGMLANNAAGARSLKYGRMVDNVEEVELLLSSGERFLIGKNTPIHHPIIQQIRQLLEQNKEEIIKKFPRIPRRVSGYNLDALIGQDTLNLSALIAGSEGTLGIVTKIKVKIAQLPQKTGLCVIHFNEFIEGFEYVDSILSLSPLSLEIIDRDIIQRGRTSPVLKESLHWLHGDPAMVLVAEFEGGNDNELQEKISQLNRFPFGYAKTVLMDPAQQEHVWKVRKAGLGLLLSKRSYSRAVAFIEDITLAPSHLAPFMKEFLSYLDSRGKKAGIYGHAGSGCLHIRPYIDLRDPNECRAMQTILEDVAEMLLKHKGSLSGEHGDGLVRSWLNPKLYGSRIYRIFQKIKKIFDPDHLMNPGKIVDAPPFLENLRLSPNTAIHELKTTLDFSKEGGFSLAADMCNGNAMCRKQEGTMCPSFQATGKEYDSTRARAQTLRGIIHGQHPIEEFSGKGLHNILDLCLQCKGCRSECPSQVDMAKMKSEFLFHYQKVHGIHLRDRIFANIGTLNRLFQPISGFLNWFHKLSITKKMQSRIGIAPERELPVLAGERFSRWKSKRKRQTGAKVLLFNDTFNEFNCPEVGKAAVVILERLGYDVISPSWTCCGRPLISKGMLGAAKKRARKLVDVLLPYAKENIPIIGLEPSCLLTITDDFQGLLGYGDKDLQTVIAKCQILDQFLAAHDFLPLKYAGTKTLFHGHCHQKALIGTQDSLKVLKKVGGSVEIASGCCGMAGSFGYEKEHYGISMKIGELKLFPAVRDADEIIIANGFSCRSQIKHATGKQALHLAEYLIQSV